MYKNQLQELAQRSCLNLPSYSCIRQGPDHAPRFKATVIFNGESFESPGFFNTLRQAEHAAAEVSLNALSKRGPTQSLAARSLDETGACKNLLQETAQRAGVNLPVYSTSRSGPGHMSVFASTVQVAGMNFVGEIAKTKKQAEKNAAMAAWTSLKQLVTEGGTSSDANEEQLQTIISRILRNAACESDTLQRTRTPPQVVRPLSTPRVRITPLEDCQEATNMQASHIPSSRTSVDATDSESSGRSTTASGMIVNGAGRQVHSLTMNRGTNSQIKFYPINQDGASTIIISNVTDGGDCSSAHLMHTPVVWAVQNQFMDAASTSQAQQTIMPFKPVTSLAPPVHVRQTVPVCSAPLCQSEPKKQVTDSAEAAPSQGLEQLKL